MTIEMCTKQCYIKNYKYAGLQYGYQCFCSNDEVRRYSIKPETDCKAICYGDSNEICGSDSNYYQRNSIYIITGMVL